jgi:hypothetical protein
MEMKFKLASFNLASNRFQYTASADDDDDDEDEDDDGFEDDACDDAEVVDLFLLRLPMVNRNEEKR